MKSFIVSLCALALILIVIFLNSYHINNISNKMIKEASELEFDNINKINKLSDYFESNIFIISLSCSDKEIDRIQESITILKSKAENKNDSGFDEQKNLLIKYISRIQEHEKLSLDNIF